MRKQFTRRVLSFELGRKLTGGHTRGRRGRSSPAIYGLMAIDPHAAIFGRTLLICYQYHFPAFVIIAEVPTTWQAYLG